MRRISINEAEFSVKCVRWVIDWKKENWVQIELIFLAVWELSKFKLKSPVIIISDIPGESTASAIESSMSEK